MYVFLTRRDTDIGKHVLTSLEDGSVYGSVKVASEVHELAVFTAEEVLRFGARWRRQPHQARPDACESLNCRQCFMGVVFSQLQHLELARTCGPTRLHGHKVRYHSGLLIYFHLSDTLNERECWPVSAYRRP